MTHRLHGSLASVAEATVVELARAGDMDAFEELVRRKQASVRNLMRRLCGSVAQAEDLSQEVFVQAWRGIGALQSNGAFWSWLRQIAVRCWMHAQQRQPRATDAHPVDTDAVEPRNADRLDLDSALGRLEPQVRLCIALSYEAGMSHGEIAAATAIPLGTVKTHIARGTQALREILSAYRTLGRIA